MLRKLLKKIGYYDLNRKYLSFTIFPYSHPCIIFGIHPTKDLDLYLQIYEGYNEEKKGIRLLTNKWDSNLVIEHRLSFQIADYSIDINSSRWKNDEEIQRETTTDHCSRECCS